MNQSFFEIYNTKHHNLPSIEVAAAAAFGASLSSKSVAAVAGIFSLNRSRAVDRIFVSQLLWDCLEFMNFTLMRKLQMNALHNLTATNEIWTKLVQKKWNSNWKMTEMINFHLKWMTDWTYVQNWKKNTPEDTTKTNE